MNSYVVIGGGLAGLAAANALAGNGNRVTLLEQSRQLGGRAQTQQQAGFSLNLGPHALYNSVAANTLRDWGIPFSGAIPPAGAHTYFVRENRLYPTIRGLSSLITSRLLNLREKLETARLLQLLAAGDARGCGTMEEWINQHSSAPRVRDIAAMLARVTTYTPDVSRLSAKAALRQISSALKDNVLYIDGGWQTLVDGLRQRAVSMGVEIQCDQQVTSLRGIAADGIVLAVGPATVEKLTGVRMPRLRPLHMATLDLGLEEVPHGAARVALAIDRPLYFSMHSASARLAPEGGAMIHIAKYLGDSESDPAVVRKELEEFATLVLPEWRQRARVTRYLPHLIVSPAMRSIEGQPDVSFLGLEGIAVAGDWVGEDGMLADAAFASALKAAKVVQQQKVLVA